MEFILQSILGFLGGLGIFLYGTHLLSNGLQQLAASKMRMYLTKLTNTRLKGVFSGIVTTFFLQSSTVTAILIVGLVGSSAITLSQAFGVVLGSAIGTTLTVQILTFNISVYSSIFIFLGAVFIIFVKQSNWKVIGLLLLSIGFIFFGIHMISSSLEPLSENPHFLHSLTSISKNPLLFGLIAMVLTVLFHSSAAMIVIGIAFVSTGVLSVHAILPLVIGANVGSTIPVIVTSLTTNLEGKKLAIFNFVFKCSGAILAFVLLPWLTHYVDLLPGNAERQIANFHTLFNIIIAALFFPLLPLVARVFEKIFPTKLEEEPVYTVRLSESMLQVPDEALNASKMEITKLANKVHEDMIQRLSDYLDGRHEGGALRQVEDLIDQSYIQIQKYLLKLGQRDLTSEQSNREVKLLNILNDIEHIGDTVVRFIGVADKVSQKNVVFNEDDVEALRKLMGHIQTTYENSLHAFDNDDTKMAKGNIQYQSTIDQFEKDIKFEHYNSLINHKENNPDISAVYLDIVNQLLQVNHHAMNISRTVLGLI
ncbi:Na/Pi cotransporter family protein [Virgibacillus halophilus]|uniref:Na/Pi cotransporter family protein n=1 Tax=Tigheibacillus halophilus TaxID=361280 RepID=A0ABU5C3Y8_9BACI|nr:Na/Pi cotransporter family protein [Virgibacillus halophilus]